MAKVIVSGNLNQYGDQGRFEADRSTWGFADGGGLPVVVRSSTQFYVGTHSALLTKLLSDGNLLLLPCRWPCVAGKNYVVKARVRTPASKPLGAGSVVITLDDAIDNLWPGTPIDIVNKIVTEATDAWVEIEASVEGSSAGIYGGDAIVYIRTDVAGIDGGRLYVDRFEVFEYVHDGGGGTGYVPPAIPLNSVWFSRNPVTFQKAAAGGWELLTNYRLYDDVRVEDVADSDTFLSKMKLAHTPNSAGQVMFVVGEAFRGVLTATPPALNLNTLERLTDRIKRFKHYTGSMTGTETEPASLTASDASLVLLGGLSKLAWPTIGTTFFTAYLAATKKFLTWAPIEKQVDRTQEDYLNFFVYDEDITEIRLLVRALYSDGSHNTSNTTSTRDTLAVSFQQLIQVPAGPVNSGALLINPAKTLIGYELWLIDQTNAVISEVRKYFIDPVSDPRKKFFMFLNSLGAFEVLRFIGQTEYTTEVSKEAVVRFLPYNYSALAGEKEVSNALLQESGSYSSGFIDGPYSRQWMEYLKDFLISRQVYDVTTGSRKPVLVTAGSYPMGADQNYERFVRFVVLDSYVDENFTPAL